MTTPTPAPQQAEREREAYEARFPGAQKWRDGDDYSQDDCRAGWEAWLARAALSSPPLYAAQAPSEPVRRPLTEAEIESIMREAFPRTKCSTAYLAFARLIERAVAHQIGGDA